MQQEIIISTILIVVVTLIASPLLISNVYGQLPAGVTGKTVILYDDLKGHSKGWNPDGKRNVFAIFDPDVSRFTSTIVVNIRSFPSINVCNVDYIFNNAGLFDIACILVHKIGDTPGSDHNVGLDVGGPAEGAELHYTVFNPSFPLPVGGLGSEVDPTVSRDTLALSKNRTQGFEGTLSPEQQGLSANVTSADGR